MRIGLIDVDGHNFPNLALMKISTYHKQQGDNVEFVNFFKEYDKVYKSKVFTFTQDEKTIIKANEIVQGGTGYDLNNKLPVEIEEMYPDYELYNIKNTAYGYLTRGCPRGCEFCIVQKKEGSKSYKVADLEQFWKGQKEIKLLDPNLLASKEHLELLKQLIKTKSYIDFTQGLDARLLTKENIELLKQIKIKIVHFAWDFMSETDKIIPKLKEFKKETNLGYQKLKVYVLTNYDTTMEENLYRIYRLKELGYDPYVMIYDKLNASKEVRKLQRWVNNKIIFRSVDKFENYRG
ncbi:radical SAM protein [Clostridioides difficile]|nr:radical SAM protein [Clostridioides difficile]MDB0438422.1 radical SAM protein [Clostridioides difficile]